MSAAFESCCAENGYQTGTKTSKYDLTEPDAISRNPCKSQVPDTPEATHNLRVKNPKVGRYLCAKKVRRFLAAVVPLQQPSAPWSCAQRRSLLPLHCPRRRTAPGRRARPARCEPVMVVSTRRISPARPRSFPEDEQTLPPTPAAPTTRQPAYARARGSTSPSTPESERLLLDQIAAGELDVHLVAIAEAVRARHEPLHTINSQKALAMLAVGDRVRINHNASPRYLHGVHGVVVELDQHAAVVCVHRQIGRFKSGEIRCPHSSSTASTPPPDQRANRRQPL